MIFLLFAVPAGAEWGNIYCRKRRRRLSSIKWWPVLNLLCSLRWKHTLLQYVLNIDCTVLYGSTQISIVFHILEDETKKTAAAEKKGWSRLAFSTEPLKTTHAADAESPVAAEHYRLLKVPWQEEKQPLKSLEIVCKLPWVTGFYLPSVSATST